jgi:outer membrane protein assembly factor BamA
MRGWPVRGIGRGSQPLAPYDTRTLNDRTGDIRFETNLEYRYNIAQIIPNSLTLKGAFFMDIGNVWNFNNSRVGGGEDSLQFNFKNFYRQLGVSAGTGFRFDFNYIILRLDLGFRFKRPEISENAGWKAPSIGFNDMFRKLFTRGENDIYRKWRYENFNFTIGLNYPF